MRRFGILKKFTLSGLLVTMPLLGGGVIRAAPPPAPASPQAQTAPAAPAAAPVANYADLADLADSAPLVLKVLIHKVAPLEPARAGDVRKGWARVYIEAEPMGVLLGPQVWPPVLRYLLDVPLDAKGKLPQLKKQVVLVFAAPVVGPPGTLQLVAPDSQLPWSLDLEARVRKLLADLAASDAPGKVTGVREAMYVPGTLSGEGETQIFLTTQGATPASITVIHKPGASVRWSASFSEVMDSSGSPPPGDTLAWYRLACFLPETLPEEANVSEGAGDKEQAAGDYRMVRAALGACGRIR